MLSHRTLHAILHLVFCWLALPCLAQITVTTPAREYGLGQMCAAAISGNGTRAATGSRTGMVAFWNLRTGKPITSLKIQDMDIEAIAMSTDGSKALTVRRADSYARLWDVQTGQIIRTYANPDASTSAAFLPDGSGILLSARENHDSVGKILDLETGERLKTFSEFGGPVVFSPDGSKVCAIYYSSIWDVATTSKTHKLEPSAFVFGETRVLPAYCAAFSPDNSKIATGNIYGYSFLWDIAEEKVLRVFHIPDDYKNVRSIAYSPDGSRILTGNDDGKLRLWDIATTTCLRTHYHQPYKSILAVGFSADGQRLYSASEDNTVRVLEKDTGELLRTMAEHTGFMQSGVFSPDGLQVLTTSDGIGRLWDRAAGRCIETFVAPGKSVLGAVFSSAGSRILTGGENVRIWESATGKVLKEFPFDGYNAKYSPDESKILASASDNNARLWDVESGQLLQTFSGHTKYITSVAFSPDGTKAVTSSYDKTARIWETATGQCLTSLTGHTYFVHQAVFSPNGTMVLTGGDSTTRLWNAATGEQIRILFNSDFIGAPYSVAFSPDGTKAVVMVSDGRARLLDIQTGDLLKTYAAYAPPSGYLGTAGVAYSPLGDYILTFADSNSIYLWAVADPTTPTLSTNWVGYH